MKRIKVLYLIGGNDDKYGAQILASNIIRSIIEHEVEYCIITAKDGLINKLCDNLGIKNYTSNYKYCTYVPLKNPMLNLAKRIIKTTQIRNENKRAIKEIEKLVDVGSFDLIHTNINRDLIGGVLSEKYSIPHIWHLQEMYDSHFGLSPIFHNQLKWMNNHCNQYIAISNIVAKDWEQHGIDRKKVKVIYNGIEMDKYQKKDTDNSPSLKIIMAGMICKEKGQENLIMAISELPSDIKKNICVDLYGEMKPEYYEHLKNLLQKLELTTIVNFKGYASNLPEMLHNYDIGVNCSKGEGFGLSTLEFMCAGLCVLAANTGANTELVKNEVNGLIFDYNDIGSLSRCITKVYESDELRRRVSDRAFCDAQEYAIEKCTNQIYSVYTRVTDNRF